MYPWSMSKFRGYFPGYSVQRSHACYLVNDCSLLDAEEVIESEEDL